MNKWIDLFFAWLPFVSLLGVWFWVSRNGGLHSRSRSGTTMIELYEQQVEETRRMNAHLERIAKALENREAGGAPR